MTPSALYLASLLGSLAHAAPGPLAPIPDGADPHAIVGGEPVAACAWPATVSIGGFCTGSFVHPSVVLYAAHCGDEVPWIRFGDDIDETAREVVPERCEVHPVGEFGFGTDFAYCILPEPVLDIPYIPPLMGCEVEDKLKVGQDTTMVGFGTTFDDDEPYGIKRWIEAPIVGFSWDEVFIGNEEVSACYGDSGGPALLQMDDGTWRVFGVTSWGGFPCEGGYFSLIHKGMLWIETAANIDITPCHDGEGRWDPNEACQGFPTDPTDVSGQWSTGCTFAPGGGSVSSCGEAFDPNQVDRDPPELFIVDPPHGSRFDLDAGASTVRLDVRVEVDDGDGWGVGELTLRIVSNDEVAFEAVDAAAPFVFESLVFPEGVWRLQAEASDRAGNFAAAQDVVFGVGVDPPPDPTEPEPEPEPEHDDATTGDAEPDDGGKEPDPYQVDATASGCACTADPGARGFGLGGLLLLAGLARRRRGRAFLASAATLLAGCSDPAPTTVSSDDTSVSTGGSTAADTSDGSETTAGDAETSPPADLPEGPVCGNGLVEEGEECDDGNTVDGDGCNADCTRSGNPIWEWIHPVEHGPATELATDLAFDDDGNVVLAGRVRDAEAATRGFIAKVEPEGETVWTTVIVDEAAADQTYTAMAITVGGDIVLAGAHREHDATAWGTAVVRLDATGRRLSTGYVAPLSNEDDLWNDVVAIEDDVVVIGRTHAPDEELGSVGAIALRRYDAEGSVVWDAPVSAPASTFGYGTIRGPSGEILVFGARTYEKHNAAWWGRLSPEGVMLEEFEHVDQLTRYRLVDAALDGESNVVACGRMTRTSAAQGVCMAFTIDGELLWQVKADGIGPGSTMCEAVDVDATGANACAGFLFHPDHSWQGAVWKFAEGELAWMRHYGGLGVAGHRFNATLVAPDDTIYVAGSNQMSDTHVWLMRLTP